jgi:hypothetical protein
MFIKHVDFNIVGVMASEETDKNCLKADTSR